MGNDITQQKLDYLQKNPVEEGFVKEVCENKYNSTIDYAGGKGLIDIEIIE